LGSSEFAWKIELRDVYRLVKRMWQLLKKLPFHGWLGLVFVIAFWTLNWSLSGLRTHWAFFPLWLGYCLLIDALVLARKGNSLLSRNPQNYVRLFIISALIWWLFELINLRSRNWIYDGKQFFSSSHYFIFASLSFSTVLPAVFGTAELISTSKWIAQIKFGPRIIPNHKTLLIFFTVGCLSLVFLLLSPLYFFPFLWLSLYFILEPLNVWLGNRSLTKYTSVGDWRPLIALWCGVLICGIFWEMWNYYSYPKWFYRIPFIDFLYIFEMPLLGYGGYIPFSLELFALYHFIIGIINPMDDQEYIQIYPR